MDGADPEDCLRRCLALVVPTSERLLLAVSGGSDSVALLGAAARLCPERCVVVHVDHGLRPDSRRDAEHTLALGRGLGLLARLVEAPPRVDDPGRSETAARRRRLAALSLVAHDHGIRWILLAHHLDDALESLLLHLLRGHRGERALLGMPTLRPHPGGASSESAVHLLRPFLFGPLPPGRDDLSRSRRGLGLPAREDPTNADRRIPRNAVRALLAADRSPLGRQALQRVRRAAHARLEACLGRTVAALDRHFHPEGLGSRLEWEAWDAPPGEDPRGYRFELLRLLGAALRAPRRLVLRRSTLERVDDLLRRGSGRALLSAWPLPLEVHASKAGLHLPGAAPRATPPGLAALAETPLHLG